MENSKILILGARGMAGHVVCTYLQETGRYDVITVCHSGNFGDKSFELDVCDTKKLEKIIATEKPAFIINCIGVLIKGATSNPVNAIYVNAYFPHLLSELAHSNNAKVIHISTDCVFSGAKGAYGDKDKKDALDIYGMTKNLGELINDTDITLRTSIIGPELKTAGEGLLHWYLTNRNSGSINGYEKSIWSGVTTLQLSEIIEKCIVNRDKIHGLIQVSNNTPISKYDLLLLFRKYFGGTVFIEKTDGKQSNKSIQASENLVLWGKAGLCKSYEEMISQLYDFMIKHRSLYKQYL